MRPWCVPDASLMRPWCVPDASLMRPWCVLNASPMRSQYFNAIFGQMKNLWKLTHPKVESTMMTEARFIFMKTHESFFCRSRKKIASIQKKMRKYGSVDKHDQSCIDAEFHLPLINILLRFGAKFLLSKDMLSEFRNFHTKITHICGKAWNYSRRVVRGNPNESAYSADSMKKSD